MRHPSLPLRMHAGVLGVLRGAGTWRRRGKCVCVWGGEAGEVRLYGWKGYREGTLVHYMRWWYNSAG